VVDQVVHPICQDSIPAHPFHINLLALHFELPYPELTLLRIDAGGGESRTEAILSKGPLIVGRLKKTVQTEYHRLCSGATAPACMSQGEVAKYVAILIEALHRRRVIPTERL
jgi:hypothetical protein